jgi:hypothetical protein
MAEAARSLSPKQILERMQRRRSAVAVLAMQSARREVKAQIRAQGLKVAHCKLYVSSEGNHLNVRALHDLLAQGVSIIVNAVDHSIPQIRQLAAAIEREMGIETYVNAYLSFAKGGAFKPHWDTHDVLAVQVHGNKRWRIWNAVVPHPLEMANDMQINASAPPDQEIELAPGDVLFIPRGEPHAANVSAERSVHLSIGLVSQTGIDFLNYICKEAAKDLILRMDLPRYSFAEQMDAHEAALKRHVYQLIDAVSMSQFLQKGDLSRFPESQTAVAGALPQIDDVLRLTLRRRVPLPDVTPESGPQPVTIGGVTQRLSPAAIDVLRWLFDHDPATLRALHVGLTPRHGPDAVTAAIRELLRFGFVVVNCGD